MRVAWHEVPGTRKKKRSVPEGQDDGLGTRLSISLGNFAHANPIFVD
jgi:hypothetical protein